MLDPRSDTKAAIRGAALRLFAERGYGAVAVRDIAERVGIRPSAIYNHFAGKQDILMRLMEDHMLGLLDAIGDAVPEAGDPAARLEAFVRFHIGYHLDQRDDVFVGYMELRSLEPGNLDRITGLRRSYEDVLRGILAEGREAGAFRVDDVAVAAMGLLAMLTGVTNWYSTAGRLDKAAIADLHVDLARRSVNAAP